MGAYWWNWSTEERVDPSAADVIARPSIGAPSMNWLAVVAEVVPTDPGALAGLLGPLGLTVFLIWVAWLLNKERQQDKAKAEAREERLLAAVEKFADALPQIGAAIKEQSESIRELKDLIDSLQAPSRRTTARRGQ